MSNRFKYTFYITTLVFGVVILFQTYLIYDLQQSKTPKTVVNDSIVSKQPEGNLKRIVLAPIPEKMDFCGEPVPLNDPEVFERMEFEWVAAQNRTTANWIILK